MSTGQVASSLPVSQTTAGYFSFGGVLFFAVLFNALQAMAEISSMYEQRPILAKHKSYAFYHPSADALAQLLVDVPIKLATLTVFNCILYFMTGLALSASQFFIFYLFTFLITMCMTSFFRALATITKTVDQALTLAGIGVLALVIYTGYVIPTQQVGWWFRWIKYINPIAYSFEALMVNQFNNMETTPCASLVPSGPGYTDSAYQVCAVTGAQPGSNTVNGLDYLAATYDYHYSHLWRNLGIVIAFWLFFLFVNVVASEFIAPVAEKGDVILFRRGHAPKTITDALESGKKASDLEHQPTNVPEGAPAGAEETSSQDDAMNALAKSEDIFSWKNLDYVIDIKGEKRKLLNDVQGWVKPGTLTALMGESGAGKTTLLNVLAQRVDTGVVTGQMLVNGHPLDSSFQRKTGYVQQQDVHMGECTVREALQFSAMLRQPKTVSKKEKYEYVEEVIRLLEMEPYAEAVVGVPGVGLNVEQRKRLTIGVELAAKPKLLLFLDEPTSGLDSQSAWSIVLFMRKLANAGQAILCTIHQPSAVLFEQFDRLLLLQKGGKTVYFGDIGKNSHTLTDYFERNGAGHCTESENPAEYILDAIGAGATASTDKDWFEIWRDSEEFQTVSHEADRLVTEGRRRHTDQSAEDAADAKHTYAMPIWSQYRLVQHRLFQQYYRSPTYISSKFLLCLVAGLFIGFTFYKSGQNVQAQQNKLFSIFLAAVLSNTLMSQIQPKFIENRDLFEVRESKSKMYSWYVWVVSSIIVELPYNMFGITLFFFPWYYAIGFWQNHAIQSLASQGGYMWLMLMAYTLWFSTFGQLAASFVPNAATAAIVSTLLFTFVILFNGVLQPPSLLVSFWQWMYHLTPFTYLIEGLYVNVTAGNPIVCSDVEVSIFSAPPAQTCAQYMTNYFAAGGFGYLTDATSQAVGGTCYYCRFSNGSEFLETVSMKYSHKWRDFVLVLAYAAFNAAATVIMFYLFRVWKFQFKKRGGSGAAGSSSPAQESKALGNAEEKASDLAGPRGGVDQAAQANSAAARTGILGSGAQAGQDRTTTTY
ncbi:Multidrug resistance protein [Savitreella phatthalungensis]